MAFFIENSQARIGVVALGIYIFIIAYSPGMGILFSSLFPIITSPSCQIYSKTDKNEWNHNLGPVPFSYSAEAFPLYLRDLGMSLSTAILWGFNFIVAFTFPRLLVALWDYSFLFFTSLLRSLFSLSWISVLPFPSFSIYICMVLTNG